MKIFLKGKCTGKRVLEAFGKCLIALTNGSPDRKYELVSTDGKFLGMSVASQEVVQEKGAKLVPYALTNRRKYFLFGPRVDKWKRSRELRIDLEPLDLRKEYEVVTIHFFGVGTIPDEEGAYQGEVFLSPPTEDFERYRSAIKKFLDIFGENLRAEWA